jgi:hypothetical protein
MLRSVYAVACGREHVAALSYGPLGACRRWFRLIPFHFTPHHFTAQPSNPYMPWPSNFLQRDKLAQHSTSL